MTRQEFIQLLAPWEVIDGTRYDTVPGDFRAYSTIEDGFRDQDLLFQNPRYSGVREAKSAEEQTIALQRSGYATGPDYTVQLNQYIQTFQLKQYDEKVMGMLIIPPWAQATVDEAVVAGLIDTPQEGSYDFYRLFTVLHRKGII